MNYNIRDTDPQATAQGRTFAVRVAYNQMLASPDLLILEKRNGDWFSVGESAASVAISASDFTSEGSTVAFLNRLVAWINANFRRLLGTASAQPASPEQVWGDGGKADIAVQRIKLTVSNDSITASL